MRSIVGFSGNARWLPGGFGGRRTRSFNRREALEHDLHEASGLSRRVRPLSGRSKKSSPSSVSTQPVARPSIRASTPVRSLCTRMHFHPLTEVVGLTAGPRTTPCRSRSARTPTGPAPLTRARPSERFQTAVTDPHNRGRASLPGSPTILGHGSRRRAAARRRPLLSACSARRSVNL
jgi:hypothetical protein